MPRSRRLTDAARRSTTTSPGLSHRIGDVLELKDRGVAHLADHGCLHAGLLGFVARSRPQRRARADRRRLLDRRRPWPSTTTPYTARGPFPVTIRLAHVLGDPLGLAIERIAVAAAAAAAAEQRRARAAARSGRTGRGRRSRRRASRSACHAVAPAPPPRAPSAGLMVPSLRYMNSNSPTVGVNSSEADGAPRRRPAPSVSVTIRWLSIRIGKRSSSISIEFHCSTPGVADPAQRQPAVGRPGRRARR